LCFGYGGDEFWVLIADVVFGHSATFAVGR
jgi:hypothetical protein